MFAVDVHPDASRGLFASGDGKDKAFVWRLIQKTEKPADKVEKQPEENAEEIKN